MTGELHISFAGRDAVSKSISLITSGSVGTVTAEFDFDVEWDGFTRTAVFVSHGAIKRVLLDDTNKCVVPWEVLVESRPLTVGVVGTKGDCVLPSVPVTITLATGICNGGALPSAPTPDIYAQLLDLAKETQQIALSVRDDADAGKFKGDKGDPGADGYTPVRGTDYWTAEDIAAIKGYVDTAILGGAW